MQDPKAEQSPEAVTCRKCYKQAHGDNASKAGCICATKLTDEQQHEMQLFVSCC